MIQNQKLDERHQAIDSKISENPKKNNLKYSCTLAPHDKLLKIRDKIILCMTKDTDYLQGINNLCQWLISPQTQ